MTVLCLTNTDGNMIDIAHTNNVACLKGCYDQLCQIQGTKIHVFCQDLKVCYLHFLEVMSLYYGEAGMRIKRYR